MRPGFIPEGQEKIPALNIDYRFSNDKITVERQGKKGEWP